MTSPVKVCGSPLAISVCRVLACLVEKGVDFQYSIPIKLSKSQICKPQPFGSVPLFQDESVSLFGSRTTCRYICEKYAERGNTELYGTDTMGKACIDQWLEIEGCCFGPPCTVLGYQLGVLSRLDDKPLAEALIKENEEELEEVLDMYERRLGESRFLAGDEFSLADLSHLPAIRYLVDATDKGHMITSRENVARWWADISSRDSWNKVVVVQNPLLFVAKNFQSFKELGQTTNT